MTTDVLVILAGAALAPAFARHGEYPGVPWRAMFWVGIAMICAGGSLP